MGGEKTVSPKNSAVAVDDEKEQGLEEFFVPELNVIVNKRHKITSASSYSTDSEILMSAVEVRGMFTVSF